MFNELFKEMLHEMQKEYIRHEKVKGDSWKQMDIYDLRALFYSSYQSFLDAPFNSKEELDQIIDMTNILLMLGQRLIEKK